LLFEKSENKSGDDKGLTHKIRQHDIEVSSFDVPYKNRIGENRIAHDEKSIPDDQKKEPLAQSSSTA